MFKIPGTLSGLSVVILAGALILPFAGQTQTTTPPAPAKKTTQSKGKAKTDNVPPGPPMTLAFLVRMVEGIKTGVTDQPRVIAFINKRGLDFVATAENIGQLMSAGAGPELVDLVTALKPPPAPPPPPPPPPPPVTGTLRFLCAPAECNIRIDGGPDKPTSGGHLSIGDLVFKAYTVDFRKDGFMPKSQRVTVASENSPEISVTLEVRPETQAKWGQQLYTSAVQALGGANGLAEFKSLTATGGATSFNEQGSQTEWTIKSVFSTEDLYELSNPASGNFAISCHDETCNPPAKAKRGKKASGPEADALNTNLRQYNRYNLLALMQHITAGNHKLAANTAPAAGKESHLMVTSPDETYDITLDGGYLPVAVTYRSSDGLVSAKISYSEYAAFGSGAKYPNLTSISLPGAKQHGIRVKYDSVAPGAK